MNPKLFTILSLALLFSCDSPREGYDGHPQFSGIYPHLAFYNNEGECGVGAIVDWAERLWVITYAPHFPFGSSDKLYEITPDLQLIIRDESIGGTPANRMIHHESNQLFIGPYVIDAERNIHVIPYDQMPGRLTGNARHLFDPAGKIYYGSMEEGFYEVDVKTFRPTLLYEDENVNREMFKEEAKNQPKNQPIADLFGAHGKGLYSGQGVLVYSNNGEPWTNTGYWVEMDAGSLSEWDGKDWKMVRRNQFVEVTGPGGIYGNKNPDTDPIWATGWDSKSILIGVRDAGKWSFYRLPKASHTYDGVRGVFTEWPRIRDIGTPEEPDYLMNMHGMFWRFPSKFSSTNSTGIRPRSAHLKVISDYIRWKGQLVFGCNDAAQNQRNSLRVAKNIKDPGQSNSNLWFTSLDQPDLLGPTTASGSVWLNEDIKAGEPSEPFLFTGWQKRGAWIINQGDVAVEFSFEVDNNGDGTWTNVRTLRIEPGKSASVNFEPGVTGEWIRALTDKSTKATVHFVYTGEDTRGNNPDEIFDGLSNITDSHSTGGLLYGLGNNRRVLGMAASHYQGSEATEVGYYELDEKMELQKKDDPETYSFITENIAIPKNVTTVDESSVVVIDGRNRRWRLPKGNEAFTSLTNDGTLNFGRDIVTQRHLFNCHGTFYELPEEDVDSYAKIRPVASHNFRINDFASYRGLLVMTGIDPKSNQGNSHIIVSNDGNAAIWAGTIDDLWKMGKPVGQGGPWKNKTVKSGEPSDPYLFGFYDRRKLSLSHNSKEAVQFTIQFEPIGHGPWMTWKEITVAPNETFVHDFPQDFQARWIRFITDTNCEATAWLEYD